MSWTCPTCGTTVSEIHAAVDCRLLARAATLVVLCAWCEQEQPTILTLREDEQLSHGICTRHAARLRADLAVEKAAND